MKKMFFSKIIVLMCFNLFFIVSHPLLLSLLLILITLSIMMSIFNSSFNMWFSFILCLIYLGGVLILFIYISSFLPNEKISSFSIISLMSLWIFLFLFFNKIVLAGDFFSVLSNSSSNFNMLFLINKISLLMFSIFYLVFILLISVFYSSFSKMPLRSVY